MTSATPVAGKTQLTESWTAYAAWAADELGMRLECDGDAFRAHDDPLEPVTDAPQKQARKSWLRRRKQEASSIPAAPPIEAQSPAGLIAALTDRIISRGRLPQLRPLRQPAAVHEIASGLLDAYTLDGGKAHVAGCMLEDAPFFRLSRVCVEGGATRVAHVFFDIDGEPVDPAVVRSLGMDSVEPYREQAPKPAVASVDPAVARALDSLECDGDADHAKDWGVALIWAKRAHGSLSFEFGERAVQVPFDGWARLLEAPPVPCPLTGRETFHLSTVEGGAIAAAEEVAVSDVTGLRRLREGLTRCAATGKLGEAEWFGASEVSGDHVLLERLVECERCGLQTSQNERSRSGCVGCSAAVRVDSDDERLVAIKERYPELAAGRWRLAETPQAYVMLNDAWLSQRVATLEKASLKLRRYARRSRFSSVWRSIQIG